MYEDFLQPIGKIYRLVDVDEYDFTGSEEGEVSETWQLVAENVMCRVDRAATPTARAPGGLVQVGEPVGFFLVTEGIQNADRFYYPFFGVGTWYLVIDATPVLTMDGFHHIEARLVLMDRPTDGLWTTS